MKDLLKTTGIENFYSGMKLSSDMLNSLNNRINELVEITNLYLKSYVNINAEEGSLTSSYTLSMVLSKVPESRRNVGVRVLFNDSEKNSWSEYVFVGESNEDINWFDLKNWKESLKPIINGGEW